MTTVSLLVGLTAFCQSHHSLKNRLAVVEDLTSAGISVKAGDRPGGVAVTASIAVACDAC